MGDLRPSSTRRLLPFVVGAAFLVLASIAAWRIVALRDTALERDRDRLTTVIENEVSNWEEALVTDLREHLDDVSGAPQEAIRIQASLRRTRRWFNSLYVWEINGEDHTLLFPFAAVPQRRDLIGASACYQRAFAVWKELRQRNDPMLVTGVARAFLLGCRKEHPLVRGAAAAEAAYQLDAAGRRAEALAAIETADFWNSSVSLMALARSSARVPPFEAANHRNFRARLLLELDRHDEALEEMYRLGLQIADLDYPDLGAPLRTHMNGLIVTLEQHDRLKQAAELGAAQRRAERRLRAGGEVFGEILPRKPDPDASPRFIRDQYADDPFVLFYGWTEGHGVALQLEQQVLLRTFLSRSAYRKHVTITDAEGAWVAGAKRGGSFVATVPFSLTLDHLRVGVRASALQLSIRSANEQWIAAIAVIMVCAALGLTALVAWAQYTFRQHELLDRQRAFTTRVTHELKTPLAGIRIMAENLEAGAFKTDDQRREMAGRIVAEADRLKARVDEVLSVARERTIPKPEPYDPEEAVLEAIDQWGPRLETAGVLLHADLHPTSEVMGDTAALRDAVGCLLDNALKYRREEIASPQVWLELQQDGRHVQISVADNGMGVPRSMRRSIFQRFVRVEGPHRGKSGGHGLGLTQVKEIVDAHSGTIQCVEGEEGGAKFIMRLPGLRGT
ncbi:MAG: HAMP domain-containing histidine kinase [Myxococcales bacterium]|nr:HAMP domain-containing histidine kinase [Myxococcales bacterium]